MNVPPIYRGHNSRPPGRPTGRLKSKYRPRGMGILPMS